MDHARFCNYNLQLRVLKLALAFFLVLYFSSTAVYGQKHKEMMNDMNVNIYDVVKEAERYFQDFTDEEKFAKGSGWKGFQRWLYENEAKYYPSGDRSQTDPYFVSKAYKNSLL